MYFQLSSFLASILQRSKAGYLWIIAGYPRLLIAVFALLFVTALGTIVISNLGGGIWYRIGVFGFGSLVTMHFALKLPKFFEADEK
ncbi:MAG: hypothetical protein AAF231_07630 [Pseudomonadota bacterium]